MKKLFILLLFSVSGFSQIIEGKVTDKNQQILPGVIVFWKSNPNLAVFTNEMGNFKINKSNKI